MSLRARPVIQGQNVNSPPPTPPPSSRDGSAGLVVDTCLTEANGHAERIAALHMIEPRADRPRPITLAADKGYDAEDFVNELRSMNATPHVTQNTNRRSSANDGRTISAPSSSELSMLATSRRVVNRAKRLSRTSRSATDFLLAIKSVVCIGLKV